MCICILKKQNETICMFMFHIYDIYWAIKLIIFLFSHDFMFVGELHIVNLVHYFLVCVVFHHFNLYISLVRDAWLVTNSFLSQMM